MINVYGSIAALSRDMDRLMADRDAALKRAEAAEAEGARLKALLEERAAAGLPAEAPAKPEVLPEHLAYLEAHAKWWDDGSAGPAVVTKAAADLSAAVARRDGGKK